METPQETQTKLIDRFVQAGGAFEQFDCLLSLAAELDELSVEDKRPDVLVSGCQSQVWLYLDWEGDVPGHGFCLRADSDTLMVRGVLRIFELMFGGQDAADVVGCPIEFVSKTELAYIFDAKRQAGVASIAGEIRAFAQAALDGDAHA
ncbi:MAG: SufE family protein [Eggerthellaceae bacterium]|nr:SufE family protein [Eggerthellaceae bacterium]